MEKGAVAECDFFLWICRTIFNGERFPPKAVVDHYIFA